MHEPIFHPYPWSEAEKNQLDYDGHLLLPGLLTPNVREKLTASLAHVNALPAIPERPSKHYAAEHDTFLASLIAHPQMLQLVNSILGSEIRYDHCVDLSRAGSNPGQTWHTHSYADDQPELGFIRVFFYVNGFAAHDGGLRVVPGSHLFRHTRMRGNTDDELRNGWLSGKTHPITGEPLHMQDLEAPPGSVIVMWTHALHAVSPRRPESDTRWTVVYAYRNPGAPSHARWISPEFEQSPPSGAEALISLY